MEDNFSHRQGGFRMIQIHNIYYALYFYYYISTSDHQALDPRGWETRSRTYHPAPIFDMVRPLASFRSLFKCHLLRSFYLPQRALSVSVNFSTRQFPKMAAMDSVHQKVESIFPPLSLGSSCDLLWPMKRTVDIRVPIQD